MKIYNFIKLIFLSLWLAPLYLFNNLLMLPFFEDKKAFIALDSQYLIKVIGYTKLDIYLTSLPSLVFIIFMVVFINKASLADKNNFNTIVVKTHIYLLALFLIVLFLYFIGFYRVISPYFYGY